MRRTRTSSGSCSTSIPYNDTAARPLWTITANTTLIDFSIGIYKVPPNTSYTPADSAPPVPAYTLALVGNSQVFVHFSEPGVSHQRRTPADWRLHLHSRTAASSRGQRITAVSPSEVVIATSRAITPEDIILPVTIQVAATVQDGATPVNTILAGSVVHRISDLGLGQLTDGLFEPVWAHDETISWNLPNGHRADPGRRVRRLQVAAGASEPYCRGTYPQRNNATYAGPALPGRWNDLLVVRRKCRHNPAEHRPVCGCRLSPDNVTILGGFSGLVPTGAGGNSAATNDSESASVSAQLRDFKIPGSIPDSRTTAFWTSFSRSRLLRDRTSTPRAS